MTDSSTPDDGSGRGTTAAEHASTDTESRMVALEEENEELRDRLASLEAAITDHEPTQSADAEDEADGQGALAGVSRRGALAAVASAGLLGVSGTASAATDHNHLSEVWTGDPGNHGLRTEVGSSTDVGFYGQSDSTSARALKGVATAGSGTTIGVEGKAASPDSIALLGNATAATGGAKGLEGRSAAKFGSGVLGNATNGSGTTKGVRGKAQSPNGRGVEGINTAGSGETYGVRGAVDSPGGYGLYTPDDAKVDGTMEVQGDIQVSGVKNFVQTVATDAGPKQVTYTSVEAGEPRTEHSDVTEMDEGVAVVELPDHFGMVTSDEERLAVQVTPYCEEAVQPQVTDRSTDRIVVKDFGGGPDAYSFAFTVKGVRQGFEDREIVGGSP